MSARTRRLLILSLTIIFILAALFAASYLSQPTTPASNEETLPPATSNPPEFVVPEAPLGTLALFTAMAAGWAALTLKRRTQL